MKPVKVDRDGTPLLMVGNYTQNTRRRRRRVQSARRSRPSSSKTSLTSLWKRPSSSNVISKKKRPSSAAYRGPLIERGTIFTKLPEQTIDMAYLNVARKFPVQSLHKQGMPIDINEQRKALLRQLKDEIAKDEKAKLTLAKILQNAK
eukprot:g6743.t1